MRLRIAKRGYIPKKEAAWIRLAAILFAFLFSSIFVIFMGHNPLHVFGSMFKGAFSSAFRWKDTLTIAIPLIITSIGIMIAFKMKFWNIGAEGQILMGAFCASFFALNFSSLPRPLLLLIMLIAGFVGGALWALIPAFLKVRYNTNETIITLMLNYIAVNWIMFLQYGPWKDPKSMGFPKIANFEDSAVVPKIFGVQGGWILALILVVGVYFFMNRSKGGFEVAVVGESTDTARYAGMNVKKIIISAVLVSGGICGIVGMLEASGVNQTLNSQISSGYGFTAIITAWLSGLNSLVIVPVSILFAGMIKGGSYIQTAYQIPQAAADVLQSMILFFVIGSEFFVQYKILVDRPKKSEIIGKEGK